MKKVISLFAFAGIILLSNCSITKQQAKSKAYKGFYDEKPVSVLIMPPINKTTNVEAKEFFFTTLCIPLSNAGYYVIPPFLSLEILKRESAYDAELFLDASLDRFGDVFGADLALFTIIEKWEKLSLLGTISVQVEYIIKSIKSNTTVYQRKGQITVNANSNNSGTGLGILAGMAAAAIQTAVTDHVLVGIACSNVTLQDLPAGPYSPSNGKDGDQIAGKKDFSISVNGGAKQIAKNTATQYSKYAK
jgi:hypothetical protein